MDYNGSHWNRFTTEIWKILAKSKLTLVKMEWADKSVDVPCRTGARFSKAPKLFGRNSGDNSLSIFKAKVSRGTKLCSHFIFIPFTIWKEKLYRLSGSQFHEWLFGLDIFSGLSRNRFLVPVEQCYKGNYINPSQREQISRWTNQNYFSVFRAKQVRALVLPPWAGC